MKISTLLFIAAAICTTASPSLLASSGKALEAQPSTISSENSASLTQAAQLTCLDADKKKGYPKQKFFIKEIDGERAGSAWSGLKKAVQLQPGKRKVILRHMFSMLYRDLEISFDAEPGKEYICTGKFDGENNFLVEIHDKASKAVVAVPTSSSCIYFGNSCTD